jgi:sugar lactone lactonase YvrE
MKKTLLFLAGLLVFNLQAQVITTVAGEGIQGYYGENVPATTAKLSSPWAGAFDAAGNMYIVDAGNEMIRKVNTSGIIVTIAGNGYYGYTGDGGPATAASLHEPIGVAIDAAGNVYISDDQNNVIRMVNTAGIISTFAGTGSAGFSGDGGQASSAQLNSQNGICFDATGNLYIADGSNRRIRMINTAGIITSIAGTGTTGYSGDGGPATAAELYNPATVAFDAAGNLYVSDQSNNRVRKINTSGIITTVAGNGTAGFSGDGGQATAADLDNTTEITVDPAGNIYLSSSNNNRVRKVNTAGIIYTIAGNGTAGFSGDGGQAYAAELNYPSGVFLDTKGSLYIADPNNARIRMVTNVVPDTNQAGISYIAPFPGCNDTIKPVITLENYGTNTLSSCLINYQIDIGSVQTYTWIGLLGSGQTVTINLPDFVSTVGSHTLVCYCSNPNKAGTSVFENIQSSAIFSIAFGTTVPLTESFESGTTLPDATWNISHTAASGSDFTISSSVAAKGSNSCMLNNLANTAGNNSLLQTVSFYDLTAFTTPALSFKAAYQQKATTNADKLQVFTSTDCGTSWVSRKVITSATLATLAGGTGTGAYMPLPSQFTTYTVALPAVAGSHNVLFRWEFLADPNGPGNNLYIDDINITDNVAGIETIEKDANLSIYPNPNNGTFIIETTNAGKQILQVFDISGRLVLSQSITKKTMIDAGSLNDGIYTLSLRSDEGMITKRLIIAK